MTTQELVGLIATGREHEFYTGVEWKKLAAKVRAYDRNECQHCKAAGRYARGEIVHHVKHLKERPDLALLISSYSTFAGNPYLIDLDLLVEDGLLKRKELNSIDWGSNPERVDFGQITLFLCHCVKKGPELHAEIPGLS